MTQMFDYTYLHRQSTAHNVDKYHRKSTKNRNITHQNKYSCLTILMIMVLKPPDNETIYIVIAQLVKTMVTTLVSARP